ncbi:glutaredoxin family protein [Labedella phragmitis]|uniref:Glutaredoxin family protein n=1 Tax=Labedella phragmitis TaxID=2498849 RepID=A0A444PT11_9MICO|nr:glutaredoxin family protein [Labedella phragmitis]RWZ50996.1 glutaredoxin family protein [Labedella phragmitis]
MTVAITLIGKPDCHLCDDARSVVESVVAEVASRSDGPEITVEELSIADDEPLRERYWEMIPVVLIDGRQHCYWRVDAGRLTNAILEDR